MKKRDLDIMKDLEKFRVMSRNDISELYFSHLKNPITNANTVLKRLVRDGQIEVNNMYSPFVYFPYKSTMKKNSTKIPHFLAIVKIYRQIKQYVDPQVFQCEPKYSKSQAEPDVFTTIKGAPFFIEIQRNIYSQKVMNEKIKRYEALYYSDQFKQFPIIIMVTNTHYNIESDELTIFQVESMHDFMKEMEMNKKKEVDQQKGIRFKIG